MNAPLMRYHGSKFRMADWIRNHFPPHRTYVEPFGGGGSVLLGKRRSEFEVYNDLDSDIVNVFRVIRHPEQCRRLADLCRYTPYAREEYELARSWEPCDRVEQARRTLFRATAGFGSAGATRDRTGFRSYEGGSASRGAVTRGPNPSLHWRRIPARLEAFCERLQGVLIECRPAMELMQRYGSPDTLIYCDPPYLHTTREMGGGSVAYRHEMSVADHEAFLDMARHSSAMVVISSYHSELYRSALDGWSAYSTQVRASGRLGSVMRAEILWVNPAAEAARMGDLFGGVHAAP